MHLWARVAEHADTIERMGDPEIRGADGTLVMDLRGTDLVALQVTVRTDYGPWHCIVVTVEDGDDESREQAARQVMELAVEAGGPLRPFVDRVAAHA